MCSEGSTGSVRELLHPGSRGGAHASPHPRWIPASSVGGGGGGGGDRGRARAAVAAVAPARFRVRGRQAMATQNWTPLYHKHRDALRDVRVPAGAPALSGARGGGGGPVIGMALLLRSDCPYAPLSTDDPSASRCHPPPPFHISSYLRSLEYSKVASY
ncbi:hypothetical protein ACP70R_037587 [Stipagrostis hirtigluma subsp. patula]